MYTGLQKPEINLHWHIRSNETHRFQWNHFTANMFPICIGSIASPWCQHLKKLNSFPPIAAYMRQWTNGLLPLQRQAITWTNVGLLSIGFLGTRFSEIWIRILSFSFKKMHLQMSSAKMAAILSRRRWVKTCSQWHPFKWNSQIPKEPFHYKHIPNFYMHFISTWQHIVIDISIQMKLTGSRATISVQTHK